MEFVKNHKNLKILTKDGFKHFDGIRRVKNIGLKITFDNGKVLRCTKGHLIEVDGIFKEAETLKVGEFVESHKIFKESNDFNADGHLMLKETKKSKIIKIEDDNELQYYYDLVNVKDGNAYLSNGFNHHNCLVVDECAFIKPSAWEEFADSIFPSQGALAWKKNIIISTAKGLNHFYEIVQRAKISTQKNKLTGEHDGTTLVEVDWREVPRYNSDGTLKDPEDFKKSIIQRYGKAYFEQNYGNNFSGSSETLIDSDILDDFKALKEEENWETSASFTDDKGRIFNSLKVYETPEPSRVYMMGVDAAKDGEDAFAVQILDITEFPFKQVASAKLQISYLEMPEYLYNWGAEYNSALMIIENNEGAGQSVADTLMQYYDYPNLYFDGNKKYPGFRTTVKSRTNVLKLMQILGNNKKIEIVDSSTIDELRKFEKVNGKYEATSGHDDMVMALAMAIVPLTDMDNFENFGAFVESLKSAEKVDTSTFLTDLAGMSFADI